MLMVFGPALVLAVLQLPAAIAGVAYDSGPIAPAGVLGCTKGSPAFRMVDGLMPEGLTLRGGGYIQGRVVRSGDYQMTLEIANGCARFLLPVRLSVRGRPILTVWDKEVELSADKRESLVRVYSDRPGLAYTVEASEPWVHVRALRGRTPLTGEALAADVLTITVDEVRLAAEANPDGAARVRPATVWLSCFRCTGTSVQVVLR